MVIDPLDMAEGLMAEVDKNLSMNNPGFAGVRQRRTRRIVDTRVALLIGLDIARSLRELRDMRWSLERMEP